MDENAFRNALNATSIPVLVLDQKWHRLFAISGKPVEVSENEKALRELLQEQGQLNIDLKNVKKLKNKLMQDIVQNMGEDQKPATPEIQKKMDECHRLINESNQKIDDIEERLLELPKEIKAINNELMFQTMAFCYATLRTNKQEEEEITEWIDRIRVELKKNIIRKQNRVINNREIYYYMHDIFGMDIINLFDMRFDEYDPTISESNKNSEDNKDSNPKKEDNASTSNKAKVTKHSKNTEQVDRNENFSSDSN